MECTGGRGGNGDDDVRLLHLLHGLCRRPFQRSGGHSIVPSGCAQEEGRRPRDPRPLPLAAPLPNEKPQRASGNESIHLSIYLCIYDNRFSAGGTPNDGDGTGRDELIFLPPSPTTKPKKSVYQVNILYLCRHGLSFKSIFGFILALLTAVLQTLPQDAFQSR